MAGDGNAATTHVHDNLATLDRLFADEDGYLRIGILRNNENDETWTIVQEKVRAGFADDSNQWAGHKFDDYIDQTILKTSEVEFRCVTSGGFWTKDFTSSLEAGKGAGIDESGYAEFENIGVRQGVKVNSYIDLGEARIAWDAANRAISISAADGSVDRISLYATGGIAALGDKTIPGGGGSGSGSGSVATSLAELTDVSLTALAVDNVLVYDGSKWKNRPMSAIKPDLSSYATQEWVESHGYLSATDLAGYATEAWVAGKGYATGADLDACISALVAGAPAAFDTLKEIADVLQANVNSIGDIMTALGNKADKTSLANYMTLDTQQTATALKTFAAGLQAYDASSDHAYKSLPFFVFHIPGVVFSRFVLNTDGVLHLMDGGATSIGGTHRRIVASAFAIPGGTAAQFLKADGSVDNNGYVKRNGDTMTGALNIDTDSFGAMVLKRNDNNNGASIQFRGSNNVYGYIGFNAASKDSSLLRWSSNTLNSYKIWDEGNDGAGSGLDADLLDGVHASSFEGYYRYQIDASSLDQDTWYPVTMNIWNSIQTRIRIQGLTDAPASWNHRPDKKMALIVDWTVNGSGWGATQVFRVIHTSNFGIGGTDSLYYPVCGIGQLSYTSEEYVFVRGGGIYDFYISRKIEPILHTSQYTSSQGQTIAPTTKQPESIKRNSALITDNVASATKLQTARTLWGRSFDGTSDVNGNMIDVGSIKTYLGITKDPNDINTAISSNAYWYGLGLGNSGYEVTLGGYFGLKIFTAYGMISMLRNGYVGIGTVTPETLLDVAGTARVQSIRIGEATISWDADNNALRIDKSLYSVAGVGSLAIGL